MVRFSKMSSSFMLESASFVWSSWNPKSHVHWWTPNARCILVPWRGLSLFGLVRWVFIIACGAKSWTMYGIRKPGGLWKPQLQYELSSVVNFYLLGGMNWWWCCLLLLWYCYSSWGCSSAVIVGARECWFQKPWPALHFKYIFNMSWGCPCIPCGLDHLSSSLAWLIFVCVT